jgi:hypothetical protein
MPEKRVEPPKPRLLDQVRQALRSRNYSPRTEKAYVFWIRRFVVFNGRNSHPDALSRARDRPLPRPPWPRASACRRPRRTRPSAPILFLYRPRPRPRDQGPAGHPARRSSPSACPIVLSPKQEVVRHSRPHAKGRVGPGGRVSAVRLAACASPRPSSCESRTSTSTARRSPSAAGKGPKGPKRTMLPPRASRSPLLTHLDRGPGRAIRTRPKGRRRRGRLRDPGGHARSPRPEVPERLGKGVGLAVGLPVRAHLASTPLRVGSASATTSTRPCIQRAFKRGPRPKTGIAKARELPHPPPLVRHPPARAGLRPPDHPGTARPLRHLHHDDLHPRAEPRAAAGVQSPYESLPPKAPLIGGLRKRLGV